MLFAIGDLHLGSGLTATKPMDVFGDKWKGHVEKIRKNWLSSVSDGDTVIISGDVSWAMDLDELSSDMDFIMSLPGEKIIFQGNHDFWFSSVSKLNSIYPDIRFIKNNFTVYEDYYICGTRGWICPGSYGFADKDMKIYKRELNRLNFSLDQAMKRGRKDAYVFLHYPPFNDKKEPSGFVEIIKQYPVKNVFYAHLHGAGCKSALIGEVDGIVYDLISADYLGFNLKRII